MKGKKNFSHQNQVEQTAGLKILLLRSRVFDLHLFWPLLSLHHALQVLLHSQPPPETESDSCSNVKTNRIISVFWPSVWCLPGLSAACPSACAGTVPSSPGGPDSSSQAVVVVQKRPTSSSRSDPGPCRSQRVVPESSPAAEGWCQCLSTGPGQRSIISTVDPQTSVPGKSCQLRFLRLGGVMFGLCFQTNHWVQALWWLGFWMVMATSPRTNMVIFLPSVPSNTCL